LHTQSLKRRPEASTWKLYPDEGVSVNWNIVSQCINATGQQENSIHLPLFGSFFTDSHYTITKFEEVKSHEEPCCQIADLFAGMSLFSHTHYDLYEKWCKFKEPMLPLFLEEEPNMTKAEKERFIILQYFDDGCKDKKLGVSLKTDRGLKTYSPRKPINFWFYAPQHEMDKAPTKGKI